MYNQEEIPLSELQIGVTYQFDGDLIPCGHDTVVRKLTAIKEDRLITECWRQWKINENLHVYKWWGKQH